MRKLFNNKEQTLIVNGLHKLMLTLEKNGIHVEHAEYMLFSILGSIIMENSSPHKLDQYVNNIKAINKTNQVKIKKKRA